MIALVLAGNSRISQLMDSALERTGCRCIRFRDPIRAVDTFFAIDPDCVLIDADVWGDYTEVVAGLAAALPARRICAIIALASSSADQASRMMAPTEGRIPTRPDSVLRLRVDPENPQAPGTLALSLLDMTGFPDLPQPCTRIYPDPRDRPSLVLLEPESLKPRSFAVLALRFGSVLAQPDTPLPIRSFAAGIHIPDCAMLLDGQRMDFSVTVASECLPFWFEIESMTDADRSRIRDCIISRSLARNPG